MTKNQSEGIQQSSVPFSSLEVRGLRVPMHLGCGEEERSKVQDVEVSLFLKFRSPPLGCTTDNLKDTVCYSDLSDEVRKILTRQPYHLIEHAAQVIYESLKKRVSYDTQLRLSFHKLYPPVGSLEGGVVFHLGDHQADERGFGST